MADIARIAETLHPLERKVLPHLRNGCTAKELEQKSGLREVEVVRALQWLENKRLVSLQTQEQEIVRLDRNGIRYVQDGLPERRLLEAVALSSGDLMEIGRQAGLDGQEIGVSIGLLKQKQVIRLQDGRNGEITDEGKGLLQREWPEETLLQQTKLPRTMSTLSPEEQRLVHALLRRKQLVCVDKQKTITIHVTSLGEALVVSGATAKEVVDQLTPELLREGTWKGKAFRRYDVEAAVPKISGGRRHFVNQAVEYIRQIWLEMGFQEMSGNMVQSAFWDLDTLFVPQDHPARQMQDTFYLKDGKQNDKILRGKIPPKLAKKIKAMHEHGGDVGSRGWGGKWSADEAAKVLLRTHTTVLSAQTITKLKTADLPAKFFSVGLIFRNEALDWKHLFEFHQVEGIVVDPDANFAHLLGYLEAFYAKMGYTKVRLRPAYFPYVEPGLEIEAFHPVKKQWVELGGAGIFRPEVVKPLLGFDCPVLAWGLGMGRIISGCYGITDIRDLNKNDLRQLQEIGWWNE